MRLLSNRPLLKFATPALVASALAAAGFAVSAWRVDAAHPIPPDAPAKPARVVEIAYHTGSRSLVLAGTVVPRIESTLGFRVAGKVVERVVDIGTTVQPGTLIARLDPADYRLAVDNARAALVSAQSDYAKARHDHERYLALRNTSAFMPQTLDQRQSAAETARAHVEQAESQLATAENNLAYTELRADAAGVVTAVQAEVGQVLAQGQGVVRVARTGELEIQVGVPEHRLALVRQATDASFELWSDPAHRYRARLRELSPSADPTTRTYPARFTVLEPPPFIGLGMTATLSFEQPDRHTFAEVPLSAIFQRGTQPAVWVVDRTTGVVELQPVVVARWRDDTALLASGVKDGDLIATAGVHKLEAGEKVKPLLQQVAAH
jgi:RND family efflux transporter MFP subunit